MTLVNNNASIKRLLKDVKEIYVDNLESEGIYYHHDPNDAMCGYALIIGPKDTLYENGYYFFKFEFPADYPHSPPKVIYNTNDGIVRFHPNFYRNGKVCLSILNTWRGEGWTSCLNIKSVLLILCSILTNEPLLNEPGIKKSHKDFDSYNNIIQYKNLSVSIIGMLDLNENIYPKEQFNAFKKIVMQHFLDNFIINQGKIQRLALLYPPKIVTTSIYNLEVVINYDILDYKIKILKKTINSIMKTQIPVNKENEKIEIKKSV